MKVAITGATGFLGKYLVDSLIKKHFGVLVIARPEERAKDIFRDAEVFECDYSYEELLDGLNGTEVLVHLVAQTLKHDSDPLRISDFYYVNIHLLENVLLAANKAGVKKFIQMSSNNVYSAQNKLPFTENQIPVPSSVYGLSKLMAENLGVYFSSKSSMNIISLRLARLFGYGERDSVIFTKHMKLAMQKKQIEVWGEGKTAIDYLYVKDAVEAIERAVGKELENGIYNVGSNKAYTISEIAEEINLVCKNEGNILFDLSKKEGGYYIKMDSSKFYYRTNWSPEWSLKDAISDMYDLYK